MTVNEIETIHAGLSELMEKDMIDYIAIILNNTCDIFVSRFTLHIPDSYDYSVLVNFYDSQDHYIGCCMGFDIEDIKYRLK